MKKNNIKKLFIMCGPSGSGKSTWIKNHEHTFNPSHAIISRDTIRFSMLKDDDNYFSKEKEVWEEFIKQIKESLENNAETYVDATHINESSRRKLLNALGESLKSIWVAAIAIQTDLDTCLRHNEQRTGRALVPAAAIENMYNSYTIPSLDEGFNKIFLYYPNAITKYIIYEKVGE